MNRKHNALVALVALLLLTALLLLVGCTEPAAATGEDWNGPRFIAERQDSNIFDSIQIITDTETGVQYLWVKAGYGGGLTVLQPATEEAKQ